MPDIHRGSRPTALRRHGREGIAFEASTLMRALVAASLPLAALGRAADARAELAADEGKRKGEKMRLILLVLGLGTLVASPVGAQPCAPVPGEISKPTCTPLLGNRLLCEGTAVMSCDPASSHVRSAEIRGPIAAKPRPAVVATPFTDEGPGNPFAVYRVQVKDLGEETQIAISAANITVGQQVPYKYLCGYTIIGKRR